MKAIIQISGWYSIIIGLFTTAAFLTVAMMGLKIVTADAEEEQAQAKKRIKHTLMFLVIALSMAGIVKYISNLFGY